MTKTVLVLGSVALAVSLAGCGLGAGASPSASPTMDPHDRAVKYVQCMRQHGIQMEDPKPGDGGIRMRGGPGGEAKLKAAETACKAFAPIREGTGKMSAAELDRMTKLAQCLRRNGVDVKDPKPGQPFTIRTTTQNAAKTDKAMKTCQKEVGLPRNPSGSGQQSNPGTDTERG